MDHHPSLYDKTKKALRIQPTKSKAKVIITYFFNFSNTSWFRSYFKQRYNSLSSKLLLVNLLDGFGCSILQLQKRMGRKVELFIRF